MDSSFITWFRSNKPEVLVLSVTAALTLLIVLSIVLVSKPPFDATLERAFEVASSIGAHTEIVDTHVIVSDRILYIEGTYESNKALDAYAAYSTTTILLPDLPVNNQSHTFTHQNISIGNDVYTKIETESPVLLSSIPASPQWRHFTRSAIPREFADIAVPGPIIENLRLLDQGGTYLRLIQARGEEVLGSTTLRRYELELSGKKTSGNLQTVMDRIGKGRIDLWIDESTSLPYMMVFRGPGYFATTTISLLNSGPITAPSSTPELVH